MFNIARCIKDTGFPANVSGLFGNELDSFIYAKKGATLAPK